MPNPAWEQADRQVAIIRQQLAQEERDVEELDRRLGQRHHQADLTHEERVAMQDELQNRQALIDELVVYLHQMDNQRQQVEQQRAQLEARMNQAAAQLRGRDVELFNLAYTVHTQRQELQEQGNELYQRDWEALHPPEGAPITRTRAELEAVTEELQALQQRTAQEMAEFEMRAHQHTVALTQHLMVNIRQRDEALHQLGQQYQALNIQHRMDVHILQQAVANMVQLGHAMTHQHNADMGNYMALAQQFQINQERYDRLEAQAREMEGAGQRLQEEHLRALRAAQQERDRLLAEARQQQQELQDNIRQVRLEREDIAQRHAEYVANEEQRARELGGRVFQERFAEVQGGLQQRADYVTIKEEEIRMAREVIARDRQDIADRAEELRKEQAEYQGKLTALNAMIAEKASSSNAGQPKPAAADLFQTHPELDAVLDGAGEGAVDEFYAGVDEGYQEHPPQDQNPTVDQGPLENPPATFTEELYDGVRRDYYAEKAAKAAARAAKGKERVQPAAGQVLMGSANLPQDEQLGRVLPKAKARALPRLLVGVTIPEPPIEFTAIETLRPVAPYDPNKPVPDLDARRLTRGELLQNVEKGVRNVANGPRSWGTASSEAWHTLPVDHRGMPYIGPGNQTRLPTTRMRGRPRQMGAVEAGVAGGKIRPRDLPNLGYRSPHDLIHFTVGANAGGRGMGGRLTTRAQMDDAIRIWDDSNPGRPHPFKITEFVGLRWTEETRKRTMNGDGTMTVVEAAHWKLRWNEKLRTMMRANERMVRVDEHLAREQREQMINETRAAYQELYPELIAKPRAAAAKPKAPAPAPKAAAGTRMLGEVTGNSPGADIGENEWDPNFESGDSVATRETEPEMFPARGPAARYVRAGGGERSAYALNLDEAMDTVQRGNVLMRGMGPDDEAPTGRTPPANVLMRAQTPPEGDGLPGGGEVAIGEMPRDELDPRIGRQRIFAEVRGALAREGLMNRAARFRNVEREGQRPEWQTDSEGETDDPPVNANRGHQPDHTTEQTGVPISPRDLALDAYVTHMDDNVRGVRVEDTPEGQRYKNLLRAGFLENATEHMKRKNLRPR